MRFAIEILNKKKEEYQTLLDLVNRQLATGNQILRSDFEVQSARKSKADYEEKLSEINDALKCLKTNFPDVQS